MASRFGFIKQRIFSAIRKKVLGRYAEGVIYRTSNGLLAAAIDDVSVGKSLGFRGSYDMPEISALQRLLSPNDVVYLIGTHIGALLVPLAQHGCRVIGYEANPETFQYVTNNIQLNNLHDVRVFNLAVGDSTRVVKFYQNRSNSGGSKIRPKKDSFMYNYDSPKTIDVSMVGLDEHVAAETLPTAKGIIMDIEGAEYYALQGMRSALTQTGFLYIEYVPHHLENVSGTSNAEFFALILPHFKYVKLMRRHATVIDLHQQREKFLAVVDDLRANEKSDDLLFLKDAQGFDVAT